MTIAQVEAEAILKKHKPEKLPSQALQEVTGGANLAPVPSFSLEDMTVSFSMEVQNGDIHNIPEDTKESLGELSTWGLAVGGKER